MQNDTTNSRGDKVGKPYPGFPLTPHRAAGQWCKKIRGKVFYFGRLADPNAALARYLDERDALQAGRTPQSRQEDQTLRELFSRFLTAKERQRDSGEIEPRTFYDYKRICDEVYGFFGGTVAVADLIAEDFGKLRSHWATRLGPVGLANQVRRARMVFKWAYDCGLIGQPIRYGDQFRMPNRRTLRLDRRTKPVRLFSAEEIRRFLDGTQEKRQLLAATLLGINCGMGSHEIAEMPACAIDFERAWITYHRPKTGVDRQCPLWPETVQALRDVLAHRKEPKDAAHAPLLFLNKFREPYVRGTGTDGIGQEFRKLQRALGILRDGVSFYSLRHSFCTVAAETHETKAIKIIMGHVREDITDNYDHGRDDAKLRLVTDHVRAWLFAKAADQHNQEQ